MPDRTLQTETINLRALADQKALIDRAAQRLGRSRTEFVLDPMREASENILLDQRLFSVEAAGFLRFRGGARYPARAERRTAAHAGDIGSLGQVTTEACN